MSITSCRSSSTGRQSEKPSLTITAESRDDALLIVKELAKALGEMKDKEESSDGVYELGNVLLRCRLLWRRQRPAPRNGATPTGDIICNRTSIKANTQSSEHGSVQQGMPANVLIGADMSPGVRDRRPQIAAADACDE